MGGEGEGPRRAQKNDNARKISIFALHKLMTMSSFLINSNYIEPKFPPCEEYTQHSGSAGSSASYHPHHPHPHAPPPPPPPPPPHLHAAHPGPALPEYFPRPRREPGYQAPAAPPGPPGPPPEALYPAQAPSYPQAPYSYSSAGSAAPGPEQPPPGASPPPPPPSKGHPGPTQPLLPGHALQRRCEAAPAAGAGTGPGCALLPDKSLPGLKGKEPVVYPWMKKIHVSTGESPGAGGGRDAPARREGGEGAAGAGMGRCVCGFFFFSSLRVS